jgi:hypothetical protein
MKKLLLLWLAAAASGCGGDVPSTGTSPAFAPAGLDAGGSSDTTAEAPFDAALTALHRSPAPADPSAIEGRCVGTIADYCATLGGRCPTYEESVERRKTMCPHWDVTTQACGRLYRSVSWREPLLGGGDEYFDPAGRLIAAYLFADYGAYCNGRSFTQKFGTIPTCPTEPLVTNVCRRRRTPS